MQTKESFGKRLKRLRTELGLTQDDIESKLNISAQAISKWENDVSCPDINILLELGDILGVTVDYLLGREQPIVVTKKVEKKNTDNLVLKIFVFQQDKSTVTVNIPFMLVVNLIKLGKKPTFNLTSDKTSNIDFNVVIELVEQGVIGKILEVVDDDTRVEIWVE